MSPVQFLFLVLVFRSVVCSSENPFGDILDDGQFQSVLQFLPTVFNALNILSSAPPPTRPSLARTLMKIYFETDEDQALESGIKHILPAVDAFATKIANIEYDTESSNTSFRKDTSVENFSHMNNNTLLNRRMGVNIKELKDNSTPNTTITKHISTKSIDYKDKMHFPSIPISLHLNDGNDDDNTNLKYISDMKSQTSKSGLKRNEFTNIKEHENEPSVKESVIKNETKKSAEHNLEQKLALSTYEYKNDASNHNFDLNNDDVDDNDDDIHYEYYYDYDVIMGDSPQNNTSIENNLAHNTNNPNINVYSIDNQKTNMISNAAEIATVQIIKNILVSDLKNMKNYESQIEEAVETTTSLNYQNSMINDKIEFNSTGSDVYKSKSNHGIKMEKYTAYHSPLPDLKLMSKRNMDKSDDRNTGVMKTTKYLGLESRTSTNRNSEKNKSGRSNTNVYRTGDTNYDFVLALIGRPVVIA